MCRSLAGVMRELLMFAIIYNAVCRQRHAAAHEQGVAPTRVSFIDTLRLMLTPSPATQPPPRLCPLRPPRIQPRQLKRQHSQFRVMTRPRSDIIRWIQQRRIAI